MAASLLDVKREPSTPAFTSTKRESSVVDIGSSDVEDSESRPAKIVKREAVSSNGPHECAGPLNCREQPSERHQRMQAASQPTSPTSGHKLFNDPIGNTKPRQPAAASTSMNKRIYSSSSSSSSASCSRPRPESLQFPQGALRITRTPGRTYACNTTSLSDLISKDHLISGLCYAFFIAQDELLGHLPVGPFAKPNVPIFIGRDPNYDPCISLAVNDLKMTVKGKPNSKQYEQLGPILRHRYKQDYGSNYHAFYGMAPGSAHSKLMALVYPAHLRIVISSCNWMDIDTVLGDNHFYIHDLPRRAKASTAIVSGFEADFLAHLTALNTPDSFIDSIKGLYDWSAVKVSLVTSTPGTHSGSTAKTTGLLRLRNVVKDLDLKLPKLEAEGKSILEVCAASIGNLNPKWLDGFFDCAMGRNKLDAAAAEDEHSAPKMKIVYPCVGDVKRAHVESQDAASNIGCHMRPWATAPQNIKDLFHRYASKDERRLTHQKFIMCYDPSNRASLPHYIYIGSANLSASAWGTLKFDNKGNPETANTKVAKINNLECGIVIPGHLLPTLLEPGTDWRDSVITYEWPAQKYNLKSEKPWNDYRWVNKHTT